MSEQAKLLPCGCGGERRTYDCGVTGKGYVECDCGMEIWARNKDEARKAWNKAMCHQPQPTDDESMVCNKCADFEVRINKMNGHIAALKRLGKYGEQTHKAPQAPSRKFNAEKSEIRSTSQKDRWSNGNDSVEEIAKEKIDDEVDVLGEELGHMFDFMDSPYLPESGYALREFEVAQEVTMHWHDRFAKAIAAMQPAIDKAVAEERARCVAVVKKIADSCDSKSTALIFHGVAEAIEQGGGDA